MSASSGLHIVPRATASRTGQSARETDPAAAGPYKISSVDSPIVDPNATRLSLDATNLYPNLGPEDGRVIGALALIAQCSERIAAAAKIDVKSDFIGYDEELIRAKDSLRKLYELRGIGDGFGAAVNAVLCALRNGEDRGFNARQFSALLSVLKQLRSKPMLHFDSAMTLLDQLEDVELDIEPPFIGALTGFLDE